MEYIYAALLLHKAGKEITEDSIKKVVEATGVKTDDSRIKAVVGALEGVNIEEAIKNAMTMAAPVAVAPAQAEGKKEEKKEDKQEEKKSEEEAAAGLGALFG
jgi:large subunit ribosomal protein L12